MDSDPPATGAGPANNSTANSCSIIDFVYTDTDTHLNEVAELYSYSEETDFALNRTSFEELMEDYGFPLKWNHMSDGQKSRALQRMADGMELTDRVTRTRAIRAVLYLAQGNFGDCLVIEEQPRFARKNIFQLYEFGFFPIFIQLIHFESDNALKMDNSTTIQTQNSLSISSSSALSNDPNVSLKLLISIVYLFVLEMNMEDTETDTDHHTELRARFKEDLSQPICGELFHLTLFEMVIKLCNGTGSKFPMKKILLLLWKLILLTMGGSDCLRERKNQYRAKAGLDTVPDDTLEVARRIRPASPPPTAVEMIDSAHQRKLNRPFKRQNVVKQSSFGDENNYNMANYAENGDEELMNDDAFENGTNGKIAKDPKDSSESPGSPRPSSPIPDDNNEYKSEEAQLKKIFFINNKTLPWTPKVRQKEIDIFLAQVRKKFIGYVLPEIDRTTTAGLPAPILESIDVLRKHLYISLGEMQIKREEDIARFPFTISEFDSESVDSFTETLYRTMLPNLPQYLISLLKLLLASVSSVRSKNEASTSGAATSAAAANVLSDVGLVQPIAATDVTNQANTVLQSLKLKIDLNRHQEIIIKAISSILLLLLKHYKINHVYQFEYIAQQLMFANCIPLVIKFISQEMAEFIVAKNTIPMLDFPACVIGEQPELTSDTIELLTETQTYCWRNVFSSINLLRILNKLTKWKNCRIMMLVLFKSAQPLKKALRIRHAMFQVYALKLLKMQAKFLGRQWRKSNMKTMSAIYQKVRHRLNDDWAFASDVDSKQLYFQTEEFLLQANINRFHNRRYEKPFPSSNINSVTAQTFSNSATQNSLRLSGEWQGQGGNNAGQSGSYAGTPSTPIANNVFFDGNGSFSNSANSHMPPGVNQALSAISEADLFQPVDNNLLSVLSRQVELTSEFKRNYELWLEREVFSYKINWDELLGKSIDPLCKLATSSTTTTTTETTELAYSQQSSAINSGMMTVIRQHSNNGNGGGGANSAISPIDHCQYLTV